MKPAIIRKYIYAASILAFMFSAVFSGAAAWSDSDQHKTNEFSGIYDIYALQDNEADLEIIKIVEDLSDPEENEQDDDGAGVFGEDEDSAAGGIVYDGEPSAEIHPEIPDEKQPDNSEITVTEEEEDDFSEIDISHDPSEEENNNLDEIDKDPEEGIEAETSVEYSESDDEYKNDNQPNAPETGQTVDAEADRADMIAEAYDNPEHMDDPDEDIDIYEMMFEFIVKFENLGNGSIPVIIDGIENEMTLENGEIVIGLKHGQTAIVKNLPVGTRYEVLETSIENCVTGGENHHGSIPVNGITVLFINYFGGEPKEPDVPEEFEEPDEFEKPNQPENAGKQTPRQGAGPKTGDESNVWLWVIIMIASVLSLGLLLSKLFRQPGLLPDILFYAIIVFIIIAALAVNEKMNERLSVFGYSGFTVLSGSMQSEIPRGSLVITKKTDSSSIMIGDDITFVRSDNVIVTHRVVSVIDDYENSGGRVFTTKGIENLEADGEAVHAGNIIGTVKYVIPDAGFALNYISENIVAVLIINGGILMGMIAAGRVIADRKKNRKEIHI